MGTKWAEHIATETLSDHSLEFLKNKRQQCLTQHEICRNQSPISPRFVPSRLLEIQGSDAKSVVLRSADEYCRPPYFTLSHCWGDLQPLKLTAQTEASLRAYKGVSIDALPKTFRDAVIVCQCLGIKYLWIDSLCIFQDNLEDWKKEAAVMRRVYTHAQCNIAATGAANSTVGLSFDREPISVTPFWIERDLKGARDKFLVLPPDYWLQDVDLGVLNRRAWVLQERHLSTRIMHFSNTQVFWECLEDKEGEISVSSNLAWPKHWQWEDKLHRRSLLNFQTTTALKKALTTSKSTRDPDWLKSIYQGWNTLICKYTMCGLTKESDKFIAIDGIVQQIERASGDLYVAGLWRETLPLSLLWSSADDEIRLSIRHRAPTWSWANVDGPVNAYDVEMHNNLGFRTVAKAKNIDTKSQIFGGRVQGSMTLQGKVFPAFATKWQTKFAQSSRSRRGLSPQVLGPPPSRFEDDADRPLPCFDQDDASQPLPESTQLICVSISEFKHDIDDCKLDDCEMCEEEIAFFIQGLVLIESAEGPGKYQRVGIMTLRNAQCTYYKKYEIKEERALTLV